MVKENWKVNTAEGAIRKQEKPNDDSLSSMAPQFIPGESKATRFISNEGKASFIFKIDASIEDQKNSQWREHKQYWHPSNLKFV